ncbi:MAG TPA: hypothetical protein VFN67_38910 [Polyangiales bacterium]|nr:hypothetical protein [Polyangiales bacterium]
MHLALSAAVVDRAPCVFRIDRAEHAVAEVLITHASVHGLSDARVRVAHHAGYEFEWHSQIDQELAGRFAQRVRPHVWDVRFLGGLREIPAKVR